jgi:hypothetical protein
MSLKVEPIILLLFIGLFLTLIALFVVQAFWPNDGEVFTAVAGVLGGFSGAFFGRINPQKAAQTEDKKP